MNIKATLKSLAQRKFTSLLLVFQLSLTIALLVNTTTLTLSTLDKMSNPLGFKIDNLINVSLVPTSNEFTDPSFYRSITLQDIAKIEAIDGVNSVTYYNQLPIQNGGTNGNIHRADLDNDDPKRVNIENVPMFHSGVNGVSNIGVELIEGRAFTKADDFSPQFYAKTLSEDAEPTIMINQSLAKVLFGDDPALGQITNNGRIVGIYKDFIVSPQRNQEEQTYSLFYNFMFSKADFTQHYIVNVEPSQMQAVKQKLKSTILSVHPERDIMHVNTMQERLGNFYERDTGLVKLFTMLCILMICITIVSSFSHATFNVTQQRKLIGIRRALGATQKDIMIYVFTQHWITVLSASIVGIGFAVALNIGLSQMITIEKPSPLLYTIAVLILFVSGSLATWLPAYKTSKISPLTATQHV